VFPPGNATFVARKDVVDKSGPDMQKTIEQVQKGLTLRVMRELNARVDIDRETPRQAAHEYLRESGYIK
jgi:glycine betaine/choline ABC-type transport system substrate-binding protein